MRTVIDGVVRGGEEIPINNLLTFQLYKGAEEVARKKCEECENFFKFAEYADEVLDHHR